MGTGRLNSATKASRFDSLGVSLPVASLALLVGVSFSLSTTARAVGMPGLSLCSASPTPPTIQFLDLRRGVLLDSLDLINGVV